MWDVRWGEMMSDAEGRGDVRDGEDTQKRHTVGKWSDKIALFLGFWSQQERSFQRSSQNKNPPFTPTQCSQRAFNMWIPNSSTLFLCCLFYTRRFRLFCLKIYLNTYQNWIHEAIHLMGSSFKIWFSESQHHKYSLPN